MENITIRRATLADLDVLLTFEQGVIEAERPFDVTIKNGDTHYYDIVHMIEAPNVELLVAETDGELIGSGYARIESSKVYLQHARHSYMGFMYVKPGHRGKGVNKMIIDALKQWSVTQNVTELRLQVYYDNAPAIKAYEKVGFTKLMVKMRMELPALSH